MSNKSEQLEFKLEKIIGIQKHAGKFRKYKLFDSYVNLFLELWSFSGFLLSYALLLCISTIRKNMLKGTPLYTHTIFIDIWFQLRLLDERSNLCSQVGINKSLETLKLRPCEKILVDFCTSAILKGLNIKLLYSKKANGETFSAEVQKS